jgi:hypothetical protein
MYLPRQHARRHVTAFSSDPDLGTVRRDRISGVRGAAPAWILVLLGAAGVAVGLLLVYFFSSCPLPDNVSSSAGPIQYSADECGSDIATIKIRPPDLVIPVNPLGAASTALVFEVEALAYRSDGGGIAPECDLGLTWQATGTLQIQGTTGNRAQITIPTGALSGPSDQWIEASPASLPAVVGSAAVRIVSQSYAIHDYVRAGYDGTVTVGLVDGAAGASPGAGPPYQCWATEPVSFVSVGVLPDLEALCPQSFEGAAVFGSKRVASYQSIDNNVWGASRIDEVDAGPAVTPLEVLPVAVWIALDGSSDLGALTLDAARAEAYQDAIADRAWANLVFRSERAGLRLDGNVSIVGDDPGEVNDLDHILDPLSGVDGGPNDVTDYTQLTTAYDPSAINVYYVGRAWGNGHYGATATRAPIVVISWATSWRPDPSTLAHEVGHALGLDHPTDGPNDNVMHGSLVDWRSRLSVGQLFVMNFGPSSWAVMRPGSARAAGCQGTRCPSWDVGVGQ